MDLSEYVVAGGSGLLRFAYTLTGDASSAEDVVQEALAKASRRWVRVGRAVDLDAYVRRMVVNAFLDRRRRRSSTEVPTDLGQRDAGPTVPDHADAQAERDLMWELLGRLPRRQRAVLVLRFYEDLDSAAIARLMGCGESTVRSQEARGLAALRRLWNALETRDEEENV